MREKERKAKSMNGWEMKGKQKPQLTSVINSGNQY